VREEEDAAWGAWISFVGKLEFVRKQLEFLFLLASPLRFDL